LGSAVQCLTLDASLALHTARISSRISQDKSLLLQYVSDKSSTSISELMDILLRAAGINFIIVPVFVI
jgi:hypothetical protein